MRLRGRGLFCRKDPSLAKFYQNSINLISLICQEEEGYGAGAGVRTDDGADVANKNFLGVKGLSNQLGEVIRLVGTVAVTDENHLMLGINHVLLHLVQQVVDAALAALHLLTGNQMAFLVHV